MSDRWTILLTGENHGIVGELGYAFDKSPDHYNRVDVIRADLYETLEAERDALIETLRIIAHEEFSEPEDAQDFAANELDRMAEQQEKSDE